MQYIKFIICAGPDERGVLPGCLISRWAHRASSILMRAFMHFPHSRSTSSNGVSPELGASPCTPAYVDHGTPLMQHEHSCAILLSACHSQRRELACKRMYVPSMHFLCLQCAHHKTSMMQPACTHLTTWTFCVKLYTCLLSYVCTQRITTALHLTYGILPLAISRAWNTADHVVIMRTFASAENKMDRGTLTLLALFVLQECAAFCRKVWSLICKHALGCTSERVIFKVAMHTH